MTWHWQPVGYVCTFQSCRNRRARGAIAHPNFGRSVNSISTYYYAHHISTIPCPRIPSYGPDCTWLYLPHHLQRKNAAGRLVLINSRPHFDSQGLWFKIDMPFQSNGLKRIRMGTFLPSVMNRKMK